MKREISFAQYRAIDLAMLTALMVFAELGIYIARSTAFTGQLMLASPCGIIVALVMMRWSGWAAIPAALGGVLYALLYGSGWRSFLTFGIGNLLVLAVLVYFKIFSKEAVRQNVLKTLLFGLLVQASMLLGRALVAFALGNSLRACISFITGDALSALFVVVAVWIIRRIEGLFEDQKSYLLRIQQERQVEGREQF